MNSNIKSYNDSQIDSIKAICDLLAHTIDKNLKYHEAKIWHGGPVWFIDGNPIVGYWAGNNKKVGKYVRLMFWSGAGFDDVKLDLGSGKFKDAHINYFDVKDIGLDDVNRWLAKSEKIQWDYKNIIKNKGKLERIG
jgi:hypothetical protein